MKTLKFKTNIKCDGCIKAVTPHLQELSSVKEWTVDTQLADKVLTVEGTSDRSAEEVITVLDKAGYIAETIA